MVGPIQFGRKTQPKALRRRGLGFRAEQVLTEMKKIHVKVSIIKTRKYYNV